MTTKRIKNLLIIFILFPVFLFSQKNDFQTWNSVELKYDKIKNIDFIFEGELRLMNNARDISKYFSDFSIKRVHNNLFSYSFGYRHIFQKNNDLIFEKKNRFYADIAFKKPISKRFEFSFRTRVQSQIDAEFGFSENVKNKIREKIKCTYDFKNTDLDVFLGLELFYLVEGDFEKIRCMAGLEKSLLEKMDLSLDGMFQKDLKTSSPELLFIFRTTLSYTI